MTTQRYFGGSKRGGTRNFNLDKDFDLLWDKYVPEPTRSDKTRFYNLRQLMRYSECVSY